MEEENNNNDNNDSNLPSVNGVGKFLESIAKERRRQKLSQRDMGERLGVSQTAYRKIETGETELKVVTMFRIMEILGMRFNSTKEESFVATSDLGNLATKQDLESMQKNIIEQIKNIMQPPAQEEDNTKDEQP